MIKENVDGRDGEDNRIIDLQTGAEQVLLDEDGAAGHSDMGYGYLVAEDNMYATPGAARVWQFGQDMRAAGQGTLVYNLTSWDGRPASGTSRTATRRPGVPIEQQMACSSNAERQNLPRVNEIVCYRLDGSMNALVVAPNMTDLNASGGGSDDYSKRPKGNLDPTGEYFIWTTNIGTNRDDAFIVRIPEHKLGVKAVRQLPRQPPLPRRHRRPHQPRLRLLHLLPIRPWRGPFQHRLPAPAPSATAVGSVDEPDQASVGGGGVVKTAGCGGCPDASAVSEQQIAGSGTLTFVASESSALRFAGWARQGSGRARRHQLRAAAAGRRRRGSRVRGLQERD